MKIHFLLMILFASLLTLIGCSSMGYYQSQINNDYLKETWMKQVYLDPNAWVAHTDPWFTSGMPNRIEDYSLRASPTAAITTSMVRVPDYGMLNIDGNFQVQIIGRQAHNSLFVVGPNEEVRQVAVEMRNNTIYIHPSKDSKGKLSKVIVRIGIHNLRGITNLGKATILGRDITSDLLTITNCDGGCVILSGCMNLAQVTELGKGTVAVIGAESFNLKVDVKGNGNVFVSGRVGVQNIVHKGDGCVGIIGADTNALSIYTTGRGLTSVAGYANVKKIIAGDSSRVYVYWVNSSGLYATLSSNARVGLAGAVTNLNIDASGTSRFEGQYLHGGNIYARTRDSAHANVTADKKLFAAAFDNSTIYFFGSPNILSRYSSHNGTVIPVWSDSTSLPTPPMGAMQMQPWSQSNKSGPAWTQAYK